ncbi:MAG: hypothetical protein ACLUEK_00055 [Oscillospiraceae bacterium]
MSPSVSAHAVGHHGQQAVFAAQLVGETAKQSCWSHARPARAPCRRQSRGPALGGRGALTAQREEDGRHDERRKQRRARY